MKLSALLPTLLRNVSAKQLLHEPLRTVLTLVGISLGVGIFTSIQLATESAFESFTSSTALLTANAPLSVVGASGSVREEVITQLRSIPGIRAVLPQSSRFLEVTNGTAPLGFFQIVGIDIFSPALREYLPETAALPRAEFVKLLGRTSAALVPAQLKDQQNVFIAPQGTKEAVEIIGTLPNDGVSQAFGGKILIFDISQFQRLFNDAGRVDRYDLLLEEGSSPETITSEILNRSIPGITVTTPGGERAQSERVTAAFRMNLRFLGSIALFAAALLVYNTVSFSVLLRRRDFGILLALGLKQSDLSKLILLEMFLLGVVGAAVGLVLGWIFSQSSLTLVSQSLSTLYLPVQVSEVALTLETLLPCFLLGPLVAVSASIIPALETASLPLRAQLSTKGASSPSRRIIRSLSIAGIALLLLALPLSHPLLLEQHISLGFLSSTAVVLGVILLIPEALLVAQKAFAAKLSLSFQLALDHIAMTLRRNSISVSAMAVSLGMFLGVTTMIASFRESVTGWITHVTKADIFISSQGVNVSEPSATLPSTVLSFVKNLPGVSDYDLLVSRKVTIDGRPVRVNGVRFETIIGYDRLPIKSDRPLAELHRDLQSKDCILVSEAFSTRSKVERGSQVTIPGLTGGRTFQICDVYYDYASDQGVVFIPHERFYELFGQSDPQGVSLYLNNGADRNEILELLRKEFSNTSFQIRDNVSIRNEVLAVFDDTFRVTRSLQWIALLVSGLVVLNTISMLILDRTREFGVLRAIGAKSSQIRNMIAAEAITIGAVSALFGTVLGLLLELLLVFVINKHFFGWSVRMTLPLELFITTIIGTVGLSWLAGVLPGAFFAKRQEATVLRYE